ncbi:MAG TPA: glycoside hydrolase family 5 protein [bacterium]|nr:glycoside hydrolase family 5 protein [bacterium]
MLTLVPLLSLLWTAPAQAQGLPDAHAINRSLSPGINYGGVFDVRPHEGEALSAREGDFKIIAAAGFKGLRLPVQWDAEAGLAPPYTLDHAYLARVDRMVNAALGSGLTVVLDVHNFDGFMADPAGQRERFLGIWAQLAHHYRGYPRTLLLEVLNEPHDKLTPELWNALMPQALAVIRRENPDRVVVLEAADWGNTPDLAWLRLPTGDRNLILSFHDFAPFRFPPQGAPWVGPQTRAWVGTAWTGSSIEDDMLRNDFDEAASYGWARGLPVNVGEYGVFAKADEASRVLWTGAMSRAARRYGFSYIYWDFKSKNFGAYDEKAGKWRDDLKNAILR